MSLDLNIVALSKLDPKDILEYADILNLWNIAGYSAGICYMPEDYFTSDKCTTESNIKRFENCADAGHHSVADHAWIEIKLTGISKALAMWLNSLRFYVTSEKSGRYTIMNVDNDQYYTKWRKKAEKYLHDRNLGLSDKQISKIAQENARMMLDINAPMTTMAYSATLRQWNIIYDWCCQAKTYWRETYGNKNLPIFHEKLSDEMLILAEKLKLINILTPGLTDIKHCFPSGIMPPIPAEINAFHHIESHGYDNIQLSIHDDIACIKSYATPAMLAQLQRHRRLTVKMDFSPAKFATIPTPLYITGDDADAEIALDWNTDICEIENQNIVPIGAGIQFTCTGSLADIYTMIAERCCGNAQREIRDFACAVRDTILYEIKETNGDALDFDSKLLWKTVADKRNNTRGFTRCCVCKCKTPCRWVTDKIYNI